VEAKATVVRERNAELAGKLADFLRFKGGLNYDQTYELVNSIEPISPEDWDDLLYYGYAA